MVDFSLSVSNEGVGVETTSFSSEHINMTLGLFVDTLGSHPSTKQHMLGASL